jgi:hypothetical protein
MKNRFILTMSLLGGILFALTGGLSAVYANPGQGVPFQDLQKQIDALGDKVKALEKQVGHADNEVKVLFLEKQIYALRHKVKALEKQLSNVDKEVTVDCTVGSISDALKSAPLAGRLIIIIEGTCTEDISITRDDVTLRGGSGEVMGQIAIDGARRIEIEGLRVTGGISAEREATLLVQNSTIEVSGITSAVAVIHGGFVELIGNPLISSDQGCAILVDSGGEVRLQDNALIQSSNSGDTCATLGVYRDGLVRLRGGNVLKDQAGSFVLVAGQGSTVRQDGGSDVFEGLVEFGSDTSADIRMANIMGNVRVTANSALRLRDSMVTGVLDISNMSSVDLERGVVMSGDTHIGWNSNLLMRRQASLTGNVYVAARSQLVFGPESGFVSGIVSCGVSLTTATPFEELTLKDFLGNPVMTTGDDPAFVYRGAVMGAPIDPATVTFVNCN